MKNQISKTEKKKTIIKTIKEKNFKMEKGEVNFNCGTSRKYPKQCLNQCKVTAKMC